MARPKNEFTNVSKLEAEAFGEPGKRTFRIQVDSASSSASIWIEEGAALSVGARHPADDGGHTGEPDWPPRPTHRPRSARAHEPRLQGYEAGARSCTRSGGLHNRGPRRDGRRGRGGPGVGQQTATRGVLRRRSQGMRLGAAALPAVRQGDRRGRPQVRPRQRAREADA